MNQTKLKHLLMIMIMIMFVFFNFLKFPTFFQFFFVYNDRMKTMIAMKLHPKEKQSNTTTVSKTIFIFPLFYTVSINNLHLHFFFFFRFKCEKKVWRERTRWPLLCPSRKQRCDRRWPTANEKRSNQHYFRWFFVVFVCFVFVFDAVLSEIEWFC